MTDQSGHSMRTLNLALTIADSAVRSDVEMYCRTTYVDGGSPACDTGRPAEGGQMEDLVIVTRALEYIALRGDVFPWRLDRLAENPQIVRFIDKD
ncbi:hypothetical protein [Pseudoxanthomonas sp. UTMC 1351]|uniref:hypothetical protein n=1 Tax=Pseudoxanthomonas sp. UTMC 1351 TaxID=2695853 RepID=UPI0034CFFAD7